MPGSFTVVEVWQISLCARRLEIPTCGRPPGSTPGCCPPLRMTRRAGCVVQGFVRSTIGDPDLRSPSGFDFGLSPSAQDDTRGELVAQSLDLRRICRSSGIVFKIRFCAGIPALFFSLKLIEKPSPVGEGGPRQWWMRSSRDRLTLFRHLIRQPAAATFSHWRRLSFVSALYV